MYITKYKIRAIGIFNFLKNLNKAISRVEILEHFKKYNSGYIYNVRGKDLNYSWDKELHTNERAIRYLAENNKIIKFYAKSGRIMYKVSQETEVSK